MGLNIKMLGLQSVKAQLEKDKEGCKKVLIATGSDMRKRAPGWIAGEVIKVYAIKKGEITPATGKGGGKKAGRITAGGTTVDSVTITYRGRLLTPTHFKMKPTARPQATETKTGKKRKAKPYQVSAEILKGKRKVLSKDAFLGTNGGGGFIPFKRTGPGRYPIKSIKTISLPQMVSSERTAPAISKKINEGVEERMQHNAKRILGG